MKEITATELSRNLPKVLDRVEHQREELTITSKNHKIARIVPG